MEDITESQGLEQNIHINNEQRVLLLAWIFMKALDDESSEQKLPNTFGQMSPVGCRYKQRFAHIDEVHSVFGF